MQSPLSLSASKVLLSRSLQVRVLFHQLFQSESWKLYRNLGVFSFTFTPIHHSFAIFRMFHALSGTKRTATGWLFHWDLRPVEFLAPRGKEVGNVVNGIVLGTSISAVARLGAGLLAHIRRCALIFIFIAVMALAEIRVLTRCCRPGPRRSQLFQQLWRYFFQKSRRHRGVRHIGAVAPAITRGAQHQVVHGAGNPYITKQTIFFHMIRLVEGPGMR